MRKMNEAKRSKGVLGKRDDFARKKFLEWSDCRNESKRSHEKLMRSIMFIRQLCPL